MTPGRPAAARARHAQTRVAALLAASLLVSALLAGCGGTAVGTATPATSPTSSPGGSPPGSPKPRPTAWPGSVIEGVTLLGKADLEITKASDDLTAATTAEDLKAMWGAADGLATLLGQVASQVDAIRGYPATVALAQAYDGSLPGMLEGSTKLRDAITAGDAAGIANASGELFGGLTAYQAARGLLGPLVEQAALMQRILVK